EFMMITNGGTLVRTRVQEVSQVGRNTQGVRLIRTSEDENVVGLQRIDEPNDDESLDDHESTELGLQHDEIDFESTHDELGRADQESDDTPELDK
ncbi:MAG: DNA gyrase C-terminal beta-propeller domain-containing protein, partial [Vibrionaceae bacterium]